MTQNPLPPDDQDRHQEPPAPEGVDLLHTKEREQAATEAARKAYALGPFGLVWLTTAAVLLSVTGLFNIVGGPLLARSLPTTDAVIVGWARHVGPRSVTYHPEISYHVGVNTYQFTSSSGLTSISGVGPDTTVRYVPSAPSHAMWSGAPWFSFDTYTWVITILGLILLGAAIYCWRIRTNWVAKGRGTGTGRVALIAGAVFVLGGGVWLVSDYLNRLAWSIPPSPNAVAILLVAFGAGWLATGAAKSRRGNRIKSPRGESNS